MTPTTPSAIKTDFVAQLKAITPSHAKHQNKKWHQAGSADEVKGAEIRTFVIHNEPGRPGETLWANGRARTYTMLIVTSYHGLAGNDDDSIIEEDAVQLENTLYRRLDPTLNGLVGVEPVGEFQELEGSEPGSKWGAHVFEVSYVADCTT